MNRFTIASVFVVGIITVVLYYKKAKKSDTVDIDMIPIDKDTITKTWIPNLDMNNFNSIKNKKHLIIDTNSEQQDKIPGSWKYY